MDEGFQIVITGSNASLLSRELGSRLTGRYISKELFHFSYREFCMFKNLEAGQESLASYLEKGGFPEYVKTEDIIKPKGKTIDVIPAWKWRLIL